MCRGEVVGSTGEPGASGAGSDMIPKETPGDAQRPGVAGLESAVSGYSFLDFYFILKTDQLSPACCKNATLSTQSHNLPF